MRQQSKKARILELEAKVESLGADVARLSGRCHQLRRLLVEMDRALEVAAPKIQLTEADGFARLGSALECCARRIAAGQLNWAAAEMLEALRLVGHRCDSQLRLIEMADKRG